MLLTDYNNNFNFQLKIFGSTPLAIFRRCQQTSTVLVSTKLYSLILAHEFKQELIHLHTLIFVLSWYCYFIDSFFYDLYFILFFSILLRLCFSWAKCQSKIISLHSQCRSKVCIHSILPNCTCEIILGLLLYTDINVHNFDTILVSNFNLL